MEDDEEDVEPHVKRWIFDVHPKKSPKSYQLTYGRVKLFLFESLHRSVSRHDLHECFQLLKLLPRETTLDPYALMRFVFILLESNKTESVNKNVIIYLESLFNKLELCKPDAFVEFLSYFIRHNRIDDASELYDQRHRFMHHKIHRHVPFVDVNLNCYGFLLKYLKWVEKAESQDTKMVRIDKSVQGWIVNAIDCLKNTTSNHEYYVMCVVRVLLFYSYFKKAYLFVHLFQSNNQNNIGAQLLFLNLINQLETLCIAMKEESSDQIVPIICDISDEERIKNRQDDLANINNFSSDMTTELLEPDKYPIKADKRNIMKNLRCLDNSSSELMEMKDFHDNHIDILRDLMDGMETIHEVRNPARWHNLKQTLEDVIGANDEVLLLDARFLWHTRYKRFWKSVDFVILAGDEISTEDKKLIRQVTKLIKSTLDRPVK